MIYRLMTSLGQLTKDNLAKLTGQTIGQSVKGSIGTIASSKKSEYWRENPEKYAEYKERQNLRRNAQRVESLNGDSASEILEEGRVQRKLQYRRKITVEFYDKRISLGENITAELIKRELTNPRTIVVKKPKYMLSFEEFVNYARSRNSYSDVCILLTTYYNETHMKKEVSYEDDIPDCDINYTDAYTPPVSSRITHWLSNYRGHMLDLDKLEAEHYQAEYDRQMAEPKVRIIENHRPWSIVKSGIDELIHIVQTENAKDPTYQNCIIPVIITAVTKDGKTEYIKKPAVPHMYDPKTRRNKYTMDMFMKNYKNGDIQLKYQENKINGFGLLLYSMVCLDFDKPIAYHSFAKDYPEVRSGSIERTPGGFHVFFSQNPKYMVAHRIDTASKFDVLAISSDGYIEKDGQMLKSTGEHVIMNTRTRSLCICYPTTGYELFNTPKLRPFNTFPDSLIPWNESRDTRASSPHVEGVEYKLTDTEQPFVEYISNTFGVSECYKASTNLVDDSVSYYFTRKGREGTCPHGETHVKNGFYVNVFPDGNAYFRCLGGECINKKMFHLGVKDYMMKCQIDDGMFESIQDIPTPEVNEFEYSFNDSLFEDYINNSALITTAYGEVHDTDKLFAIFDKFNVLYETPGAQALIRLSYANTGVPGVPVQLDFQEKKKVYNNVKISNLVRRNGKHVVLKDTFFSAWVSRTTAYDGFVTLPNRPFGKYITETYSSKNKLNLFNIWSGVEAHINYNALVENKERERSKLLSDPTLLSILDVMRALCNDDDALFRYFMNWLWLVVNGRKTGKAICFVNSAGGVGKGVILGFLSKYLLGVRMCASATVNTALGEFNGSLDNKLLVIMDEVEKLDYNNVQRLKNLLTEPMVTIHAKNKEAVTTVDNFMNFILTSNYIFEHEDRRFVKIQPSQRLKENEFLAELAIKTKDAPCYMESIGVGLFAWLEDFVVNNYVNINTPPPTNNLRGMFNAPSEFQTFDRLMTRVYAHLKNTKTTKVIYKEEIETKVVEEFAKMFPNQKFNARNFINTLMRVFGLNWDRKYGQHKRHGFEMPTYEEYNEILVSMNWLSEEAADLETIYEDPDESGEAWEM